MRVGIVVGKPEGKDVAAQLERAFRRRGVDCVVADSLAYEIKEDFYTDLSVIISVGGDGTILACARRAAPRDIPVLGINFGRLGFMTEVEPESIQDAVDRVVDGDYRLERRLMLEARAQGRSWYALNEILLEGMNRGSLMWFETMVDEGLPDRTACDGVMVSSPTGSTAYSLSCGGPILSPELDALILISVCPHTLRSRPLVVMPDSVITLRSGDTYSARLYADGQPEAVMKAGDSVLVQRAPFDLKMIRFTRGDFYALVRRKLSEWSHI